MMVQQKRPKRPVHGVLLIDKPKGMSSNAVLQRVKYLMQAEKAGHTGNLDPMATGVLPICLGEATKFSQFLLDSDKTYRVLVKLGIQTTTGDEEGDIISEQPVPPLSLEALKTILSQVIGPISQVPPMYSALKHKGKPLYQYARAGIEVEREARQIIIHRIDLHRYEGDLLDLTVHCSKGTYIRVLCEEIGKLIGCGAYMGALRRIQVNHFLIENTMTLKQLEELVQTGLEQADTHLLPLDILVDALPEVELDLDSSHYFQQGQGLWQAKLPTTGLMRVYQAETRLFLGIGSITHDGRLNPKRLAVLTSN